MDFINFSLKKENVNYQHAGEPKMPYLTLYSVVCEEVPVAASWANMITSIAIKDILDPLNINFNTFLTEGFLDKIDKAIIDIKNNSI